MHASPRRASVKRQGSSAVDLLLPGGQDSDQGEVFVFRSWPGLSATGWRAGLAGGDSGGPSFVRAPDGRLELVGINTFVFGAGPGQAGSFIAGGGGIVLAPHVQWIHSVLSEVPEPASGPPVRDRHCAYPRRGRAAWRRRVREGQ